MIPLSNCTVTVTRVEDSMTVDPYDPPADHASPTTIATDVRAVISPPNGRSRQVGGTRVVYDADLRCDPTDIHPNDLVTDSNGLAWQVQSASQIDSVGLVFTLAAIRRVEGAT